MFVSGISIYIAPLIQEHKQFIFVQCGVLGTHQGQVMRNGRVDNRCPVCHHLGGKSSEYPLYNPVLFGQETRSAMKFRSLSLTACSFEQCIKSILARGTHPLFSFHVSLLTHTSLRYDPSLVCVDGHTAHAASSDTTFVENLCGRVAQKDAGSRQQHGSCG